MINPNKAFNIDDYKEIVLRRLPYIIIPFVLIVVGAVLYAFLAPKTYEAKTLILVTSQRVPTDFVKTTITSKITERLQSIEQEITSRTGLEQIIKDNNLYPKQTKSLPMEEVVAMMRKDIKVEIARGQGGEAGGYFTINYASADPRTAAVVTNRLADLFIEGNLRIREQQAKGTTDFLKDELGTAKTKLEEQDKLISDFKRKHTGELPEQRDTNLQMLTQLQQIYQRTGESLRSAQDRKLIIQKQLTDLEFPVTSAQADRGQQQTASGLPSPTSSTRAGGAQEPQLYELKNQLADLKTKYTDKHPDIVRIKKKIKEMESNQDLDFNNNPRYRELNSQVQAVNLEIKRLQEEEARLKGEIEKYRARIERTGQREQDMASLTREYQSTKESYETLLKKSQEAAQAENLERRQKGEQFRVIDAAAIPEKPVKPNRERVLLFGLLLGLGSGLGLAFVREQMDRTFHDPEDVEVALGIKILASIPRVVEKEEKAA